MKPYFWPGFWSGFGKGKETRKTQKDSVQICKKKGKKRIILAGKQVLLPGSKSKRGLNIVLRSCCLGSQCKGVLVRIFSQISLMLFYFVLAFNLWSLSVETLMYWLLASIFCSTARRCVFVLPRPSCCPLKKLVYVEQLIVVFFWGAGLNILV